MRAAAILALCVLAAPAHAQPADVLLNCSACHRVRAAPDARPSIYPDLRGQPARYIVRQLYAFRNGLRQHRQMRQTAVMLGQGDAAMARLYTEAPVPELSPPQAEMPPLVADGDWERGLPPCESCHSLDPGERGRLAPRLHGQNANYLSGQLRAYAEGRRMSDPMGRMRAFADELSESEISALADWYAGWSAPGGKASDTSEASND